MLPAKEAPFPIRSNMFRPLIWVLVLCSHFASSQTTFTVSGTVSDAASGESLIGAYIRHLGSNTAAASNAYGFFSISLPSGSQQLTISMLGYQTDTVVLNLSADTRINIELRESTIQMGEVVVTGEKPNDNITNIQMSVTQLSAKEIQRIPQLLGETDVIRTLTLLPGVTTVGEGASGLNVRGGNADQNLILLDEAPVFSSSHLFGFFSVFNADAVNDVKLYKGGIPSSYGGRLSSVLDVRQKEGNSRQFGANGGIGLLSSRLMLEGPIIKDTMSFMIAGRRSYMDLFIPLFDNEDIQGSSLYFYDLNAKLNYKFSDRSRLFISSYLGRDLLGFDELFDFGWGNVTTTVRWNYLFSDKLFMNLTAVYSDYDYTIETPEDEDGGNFFSLDSRIRNYMNNLNFTWYASNAHQVDFGYNLTNYVFDPGDILGSTQGQEIDLSLDSEYALEAAAYISDEWRLTDNLTLLAGLRYSGLVNYGPRSVQTYRNGAVILDDSTAIDTLSFGNREVVESHFDWRGLEPRLALNYTIDPSQSVKLSYNRTRQYIHLISNTTSPTPVDIWRPAGRYIQPSTADQVALGYFRNLFDNKIKISVEAYYKYFSDLVDYKDGADLIFEEFIETELLTGIGRSYGLEIMIEKKSGWFTGWISYTLSRSERRVEGPLRALQINNGDWYPANFDKPHDLTIVANAALSEKWDVSANFAFQTGRPVTYPDGISEYQGIYYPIYTNRNGARIPNYHRLDLSATYVLSKKEKWEHSLSFGVYNVYGRHNPYSIFFRGNEDTGQPEAVQLSIFAAPIPFLTYNFKF